VHCDTVLYVLVFNVSCTIQHCAAIFNKPYIMAAVCHLGFVIPNFLPPTMSVSSLPMV